MRNKKSPRSNRSGTESARASARPASPADLRWDDIEQALEGRSHRNRSIENELQVLFGETLLAELRLLATDAVRNRSRGTAQKVYLLPGIMGSTLGVKDSVLWFDDTLWLDPIDIALNQLDRLALDARGAPSDRQVGALDLFPIVYMRMNLALKRAGYEVVRFPFDWRLDIAELGRRLAEQIRAETAPVSIVAHSMGGLVARAALNQLAAADNRKVSRLIMLGTPNHGSFAPAKALTGCHDITRKLALIDFDDDELDWAERIFRTFDGLVQMLPDPEVYREGTFYAAEGWPAGLPSLPAPRVFEQALSSWRTQLAPGDKRMVLVAGVNQDTTARMDVRNNAVHFQKNRRGDGTVPLAFAELANIKATYYVEGEHMWLPFNQATIDGVLALLRDSPPSSLTPRDEYRWLPGSEQLVDEPVTPRRTRGAKPVTSLKKPFPRPPVSLLAPPDASKATGSDVRETVETVEISRTRQYPLEITLAKGDIRALNCRAIAVGIFEKVRPSGAALALDQALDGAIGALIDRRMFSAGLGEIFVLPAARRRIPAEYIVFVGLGDFDRFDGGAQRIAAASLARTLLQLNIEDAGFVLFGAGSGFDARSSLAEALRGFIDGASGAPSGRIRAITVCERDPDRYREICSETRAMLHTDLFDNIKVFLRTCELPAPFETVAAGVRAGPAAPESTYLMLRGEGTPGVGDFVLQASVLAPGARAAIISERSRVTAKQWQEIRDLLPSGKGPTDLEALGVLIGGTLHEAVQRTLATHAARPLVVVHDAPASAFPWECMAVKDDAAATRWPAKEGGLHRYFAAEGLTSARWRSRPEGDGALQILLVANPTGDLSGAEKEANELQRLLSTGLPTATIHVLKREQATRPAILAELRKGTYDVLHYAGHAFFDPQHRGKCGLICAGDEYLVGDDIRAIPNLPGLILLNACESARIRAKNPRQKFAVHSARVLEEKEVVSLGEGFLRAGVANFIGTYWPVNDTEAATFARNVYEGLARGVTLGEAVQSGRKALADAHSTDWADYMLFGAPGFRL